MADQKIPLVWLEVISGVQTAKGKSGGKGVRKKGKAAV